MNFSIFPEVINIRYSKKELEAANSYIFSRPHFKIKEDDFFS